MPIYSWKFKKCMLNFTKKEDLIMYIEIEKDYYKNEQKIIEIDAEALIDLLRHGKTEFQNIIIKVI